MLLLWKPFLILGLGRDRHGTYYLLELDIYGGGGHGDILGSRRQDSTLWIVGPEKLPLEVATQLQLGS
ncbi:hypothetical protein LEMLEM_LOCUS3805 [Lemmus lemmus]